MAADDFESWLEDASQDPRGLKGFEEYRRRKLEERAERQRRELGRAHPSVVVGEPGYRPRGPLYGDWVGVESSNIAAIRYVPELDELQVSFSTGSLPHGYKWRPAKGRKQPEWTTRHYAEDFLSAPSKGTWWWDNVGQRGAPAGTSYQPGVEARRL
jgi:hypothetical protein